MVCIFFIINQSIVFEIGVILADECVFCYIVVIYFDINQISESAVCPGFALFFFSRSWCPPRAMYFAVHGCAPTRPLSRIIMSSNATPLPRRRTTENRHQLDAAEMIKPVRRSLFHRFPNAWRKTAGQFLTAKISLRNTGGSHCCCRNSRRHSYRRHSRSR